MEAVAEDLDGEVAADVAAKPEGQGRLVLCVKTEPPVLEDRFEEAAGIRWVPTIVTQLANLGDVVW